LNNYKLIIPLIIFTLIFNTCSSTDKPRSTTSDIDGLDITARGAIGRLETAVSGPMYTGNGGSNIRLAILSPDVQGDVPSYLPLYIQGLLNNNFNKYSAVNLIDRQNLNKIISEQNLTTSGRFSDNDFVRIGNLTNTQFFLFGTIQKLSGNRYSLQLSVTEASTGVRKATFMKEGSLAQLEGRATLLNEAAAELLAQLGVQLTEAGKRSLLAGNISTVQAEAGLARGITAQAGGSEVEALLNYAQAITFDSSQLEALSRLNTLSTTISGGTISQRILNDIQARDRWVEAFKETAQFFEKHPPFEIIFDPNLIQIGETDYSRRTVRLGMRIALDASVAGFDALNALLDGLERTGRRGTWGFSGWPLMDISPRTAGTVVFGGNRSFSFKVDVALINENNKRIGNGSTTLKIDPITFSSGDKTVSIPFSVDDVINFNNVKTEDLTDTLTIAIISVNGISSGNLASTGYMRVETGGLEKSEHSSDIISVVYSPDGKQIVTGSNDGTAKLWDVATGREIRTFSGHSTYVNSVAYSPDGKQIVTGSADGTAKLWDVATGREIRSFSGHSDVVRSVAFSPDGKQIVTGSDRTAKLWDVATGREIRSFSGHSGPFSFISSVAYSSDGKQIVTGSLEYKTVKLWDVATGREIRSFSGHSGPFSFISSAISPDGKQIVTGSHDGTAKLWDVATGREINTFFGHSESIYYICFSPNGMLIATGSWDKFVILWDVISGRRIRTFYNHQKVSYIAFSPDGKLIVSGSNYNTIKFWDVASGRLLRTIGTERDGI